MILKSSPTSSTPERCWALLAALGVATTAPAAITFNLNFLNNAGETWTAARQAVVAQAANEWGALFVMDQSIDVNVTFEAAGTESYLGQWGGGLSFFDGDSTRPWLNSSHTIRFNTSLMDTEAANYLWWDESPLTEGDQPGSAWDALSVARHEFGHLVGFTSNFYVDNINLPSEIDFWGNLVDGSGVFDPGGLNVQLSDGVHLDSTGIDPADQDLMSSTLTNGFRREISELNLAMLSTAYGYVFIPESGHISFLAGAALLLGLLGQRRRSGRER